MMAMCWSFILYLRILSGKNRWSSPATPEGGAAIAWAKD
jgi:hypothetical protein